MFFRQVLHDDLGCASYVIADGGEAVVVDPKWEIADYLALAGEHGFRITHILETHNHADHVSGRGRLAAATGARIHVPAKADVAFEHAALEDGDAVTVGGVRVRALATPGHRPEHTAYVVEDGSRSEEPWLVLAGDSLFVGDLARPDLAVEPEEGARGLHRSLRRLLELPDYVEVWPGHIGGSLCGGAGMSEKPLSTIGFERRFNRLARIDDEERFVRELTAGGRPQPPNFECIVELNRGPLLEDVRPVGLLAPPRVAELLEAGATLLDGRSPREFDSAHVVGSINIAMVESAVGTRAAWVVDVDADVIVLAASDDAARAMADMLAAVGLTGVRGIATGGISAWQDAGLPVGSTRAIDVAGLVERLEGGKVAVLDVREEDEWEEGHLPGSLHVPYHELKDGVPRAVREAAEERCLAVACSAGNRSSIAASLLARHGVRRVEHVTDGGIPDLERHGIALEEGKQAVAAG